jgi:hypothetical protein
MVILRSLSDGEEGGFTKIPPRGSALETQIRNHHTRPDGSIDYDGYFKSLMNVPEVAKFFTRKGGLNCEPLKITY